MNYKDFSHCHPIPVCWFCGRWGHEVPERWNSPWLLEKCHIVNKPRVCDVRVIVLMCSGCHKKSHGLEIAGFDIEAPTLANMIWLKKIFDPDRFDLAFLRKHSIGNLPEPKEPPDSVQKEFRKRHGDYPI